MSRPMIVLLLRSVDARPLGGLKVRWSAEGRSRR
jgi:hypothetical protein